MNFAQAKKIKDHFATIVDLVERHAESRGEQTAFTFLGSTGEEVERISYQELRDRSRAVAALLYERGYAGRTAFIAYPPGLDFVISFLGCMFAGVIAVPGYPPRTNKPDSHVQAILLDSQAALVFGPAAIGPTVAQIAQCPVLDISGLDASCSASFDSLASFASADIAFLQYTSGSTSAPKGVMVSHGNIISNLESIRIDFGLGTETVGVFWLPPYHDMGLIGGILQPIYSGFHSVLMAPTSFTRRPYLWLEAISKYRATLSGGPNFAYALCASNSQPLPEGLDLICWQTAFNGAEPINEETMVNFAKRFEPAGFSPSAYLACYGLAEATLFVSCRRGIRSRVEVHEAISTDATSSRRVSCGFAGHGITVQIVDPLSGRNCAPEEQGEIVVTGPNVTQGYWRKPEISGQTFRLAGETAPFNSVRTGDLGYFAKGQLFISGRLKDLVIIAGQNFHPQDMEAVVQECAPSFRQNGVVAFSLPGGADTSERLIIVAEVGRVEAKKFDFGAVANAVQHALRETFKVAANAVVFVRFGSLKLTTSGKLRRGDCRKDFSNDNLNVLWDSRVALIESAAEADIEGQIAAAAGAIGLSPADFSQPLRSLGIDSMSALLFANAVASSTGKTVRPHDLLGDVTINELIARLKLQAPQDPLPGVSMVARRALTANQSGIYFWQRRYPEDRAYLLSRAFSVRGKFDAERARDVLLMLTARHPTLRSHVVEEKNGDLYFEPQPDSALCLRILEECGMGSEHLAEDVGHPFDLRRETPLRASIFRVGPTEQIIQFTVHHLAMDLWSMQMFFREFFAVYAGSAEFAFVPSPLPAEAEDETHFSSQFSYWEDKLRALPSRLALGTRGSQGDGARERKFCSSVDIGSELFEGVGRLVTQLGATPAQLLLSAYFVLLKRYAQVDDLVVGLLTHGRDNPILQSVMDYRVNPLPIRMRFEGEDSLRDIAVRSRDLVLEALDHQAVAFASLAARCGDADQQPIFQTTFSFHRIVDARVPASVILGEQSEEFSIESFSVRSLQSPPVPPMFDVNLIAVEHSEGIRVAFEFDRSVIDNEIAQNFSRHYVNVLKQMMRDAAARVDDFSFLSSVERDGLTRASAHPFNYDGPGLLEAIERSIRGRPAGIAIKKGMQSLSYSELGARADKLAGAIYQLGLRKGDRLAIGLEVGPDFLVSILAALRLGAVYVPVDNSMPAERQASVLSGSSAKLLLTDDRARHFTLAPEQTAVFTIEDALGSWCGAPHPPICNDPHDPIYIIFTSGSTGTPKGAQVRHDGFLNLLNWYREALEATDRDQFLILSAIGFDLTQKNLFLPLIVGGTLHLRDGVVFDPVPILATMERESITVVNCTPSAAYTLAEQTTNARQVASLRYLVLGGEPILIDRLKKWFGDPACTAQLMNSYGPSECTDVCAAFTATKPVLDLSSFPIGRPIPNTYAHILDEHMQLLPQGATGDLWIGGICVGSGYINDPALTAAKFCRDPFNPDRIIYNSGDRARYLGDGNIEYLGRRDSQIKIRGYRVELGEIEGALNGQPEIREAVVLPFIDTNGDQFLAAYVVFVQAPVDEATLIARLASRLPAYMVPSRIVSRDAFPVSVNGKVNRAGFVRPERPRNVGFLEASTLVDAGLAAIWRETLGVTGVSPSDDFFVCGGHSLTAMRMAARMSERLGIECPISAIFENRTAGALSLVVWRLQEASTSPSAHIPVSDMSSGIVSSGQARLWYLSSFAEAGAAYHICAGFRLEGYLDEDALERALARLAERHPALRSVLETPGEDGGIPRQRILPPGAAPVVLARGEISAEDSEAAWIVREASLPFDLFVAPSVRARLLRHRPGRWLLLLTMHHLFFDGWSAGIFLDELSALYSAEKDGTDISLPVQALTPVDYANWQQRRLQGEEGRRLEEAWREALSGAPALLELPLDRARPPVQEFVGDSLAFTIPSHLMARLKALGMEYEATPFMVLLALFSVLLGRYSGQDDVVVGAPFANRPRPELEPLIGFFTNTLPLRLRFPEGARLADCIHQARTVTLDAQSRQELPFERIVDVLSIERSAAANPLFQAMLVYQEDGAERLRLPGVAIEAVTCPTNTAKFDVTLTITDATDGVRAEIEYATALFDHQTIARMVNHFLTLLETACENPHQKWETVDNILGGIGRRPKRPSPALFATQPADDELHPVLEEIILDIWKETVEWDDLSVNDNFFTHGGNSLNAVRVAMKLQANLAANVPVRVLFEFPTARKLTNTLMDPRNDYLSEQARNLVRETNSRRE